MTSRERTLAEKVVAIIAQLETEGLPCAIGGALALAYYVEPRVTRDVDVNVFVGADRSGDVSAALRAIGADVADTVAAALAADGQVRVYLDSTPVDVFINSVPLHDAMPAHVRRVPFADTEIPILGPDELAVCKAAFNRSKDWDDIDQMARAGVLDGPVVQAWLDQMMGPESEVARRMRASVAHDALD